ncbi:MAG: hypothetical protein QXS66_08965 [Thermoproteota archaeon]
MHETEDFNPFDLFGDSSIERGKLRTRLKTCPKSKYLEASEEIISLAKDTLSEKELNLAENVAKMLIGTKKDKKQAIEILIRLVSPPPKRPLYYAQHELRFLPRWTRDAIRYMGDYIDALVKAMAFEFSGDKNCLKKSLGINLKKIKSSVPPELFNKLSRYNEFLYVAAKHDFKVPPEREHRFTSREVVLTAFVSMKLASEIKNISRMARKYSEK